MKIYICIYIYKKLASGGIQWYTLTTTTKKRNINKLEFFSVFLRKKKHTGTLQKGHTNQGGAAFFLKHPPLGEGKKIVQLHVSHEFHTTNL